MNSEPKAEYTLKILTIGESGVGKTCVLLRYTDNKFIKTHLTTIGIDYKAKTISIGGKTIRLKIWDTAGQERFKNITQQYYKNADGILLVFDVSDRNSYEKVREWMKQIQLYCVKETIGMVLIGNKCDVENREVSFEDGEKLAKEFNIKYFETSALNNYNIEETFIYLSQEIMRVKDFKESNKNKEEDNGRKTLDAQNNGKKSKDGKCC
jgi:Ras-related protein Rab-8A